LRLAPPLVAREPLLILNKLGVGKLINSLAEFNSAHGGVLLAVPPRYVIADKTERRAMHGLANLRWFLGH
jgi:hypothetical protein